MKLTGLQIRNMQMLQDIEKMIKELEIKRIEHDLLNKNKYAELYKVCISVISIKTRIIN